MLEYLFNESKNLLKSILFTFEIGLVKQNEVNQKFKKLSSH